MFFRKKINLNNEEVKPQGKKASFWGASDRMICCKGIASDIDEFNVTSYPKLKDGGDVATLEISAPDEDQGLFIHAFYSGHWSFAVSPSCADLDELPSWHIEREWGTTNSHSETLNIYCPKGATVRAVDRIETSG